MLGERCRCFSTRWVTTTSDRFSLVLQSAMRSAAASVNVILPTVDERAASTVKCAPLSNVLSHKQCAGCLASESLYFAPWIGGAEIAMLVLVRAEGAATAGFDTYRARDPCLI